MALALNFASKFSAKVDERFSKEAFTAGIINNSYDFVGVNAVTIYDVPTVPLTNYTMSGMSRYGTPSELQNDTQTLTMTQDKSFTFTIDKRNNLDTMGVMEAAAALARELREVIIPHVDKYRIAKIAAEAVTAGNVNATKAPSTKADAYEHFLEANEVLDEALAPQSGRVAIVTPAYYNLIKLDPSFTKYGDMATQIAIKGAVGEIDGVTIVKAPSTYFPADTEFVIANSIATVSPVKIADYKIHSDVPGISGKLVEGRIYFDAFVLKNKAKALYARKSA